MNLAINLSQAATLIANVGHNTTVLLRGAPGIGKSSILKQLASQFPDYDPCYIDVQQLDLGDVGMPVVDRDRMVTNFAPNARFGLQRGGTRPILLMLDELTKAARPVLNMLLPVILERRLGDVELPAGSIVFATGNLDSDGVSDSLPAHAYNRMTVVRVSNPTPDEWLAWAATADVAPEVMAFAKEYPQVFDCYADLDEKDNNPYIFNPRNGQTRAFCSPRSLEKASNLIKARTALGDALLPALAGTLGESGARDMEAMVHLADRTPRFDDVVKNPTKCKLPDGPGAYFFMAFMLAGRCTAETLPTIMEYINRWESFEATTLFMSQVACNPNKVKFACACREWTEAAAKCGKYF